MNKCALGLDVAVGRYDFIQDFLRANPAHGWLAKSLNTGGIDAQEIGVVDVHTDTMIGRSGGMGLTTEILVHTPLLCELGRQRATE